MCEYECAMTAMTKITNHNNISNANKRQHMMCALLWRRQILLIYTKLYSYAISPAIEQFNTGVLCVAMHQTTGIKRTNTHTTGYSLFSVWFSHPFELPLDEVCLFDLIQFTFSYVYLFSVDGRTYIHINSLN